MAGKTFTQMSDEEFKELLDRIRGSDGQKKYSKSEFVIGCLHNEAINLTRLKTLLGALNENDNIHSLYFSIDDGWLNLSAPVRGMNAEGATAIAEFLKTNTTIHTLNLSNHSIGTEGANILAEALRVNQTLQKIDLTNCSITDSTQIVKVLGANQCINWIYLSDNPFSHDAASNIAEILKLNKTLSTLKFSLIDDKSACVLAEGLEQNDTLRKLVLDGNSLEVVGFEALSKLVRENNFSLEEVFFRPSPEISSLLKSPAIAWGTSLARNKAIHDLNNSIIRFRNNLHAFSIPMKTKSIFRSDLEKYLGWTIASSTETEWILDRYSFPIAFDKLFKEDQDLILDAQKMWSDPKVTEENRGTNALWEYKSNLKQIKNIKEKYENTAANPVLKEKINKKLQDLTESLDLAYYGHDAECLQLDPAVRVAKLEAIIKTTENKAHQEDARESLLPLYYLLMERTKDNPELAKIYALSSLACGAEEAGIFSREDIAEEYKIENIEEELKKRKEELNLDDKPAEEKKSAETNIQKVHSNPMKSAFTTFHPHSVGATTNATPGASSSPTPNNEKPNPT